MSQERRLKVCSYARPHTVLFPEEEFSTVGQFQHAIEEWFGIPIHQQKLLRDGKIIPEAWQTASFRELNLKPDTHLVVLTKSPLSLKSRQSKKPADAATDTSIANIIVKAEGSKGERGQQRQINNQGSVKVLTCLKDEAKDAIVVQFVKALRIPKAELLLLDEPKLRFVLEKASEERPVLREMLLNSLAAVRKGLIDEQKLQSAKTVPETAPAEAISFLGSLGYARERSVRALEICRNDVYAALSVLCGENRLEAISFQRGGDLVSEFISIWEWLRSPLNKPVVLYLRHKPGELAVFLNSWKHSCPELFEVAVVVVRQSPAGVARWRDCCGSAVNVMVCADCLNQTS